MLSLLLACAGTPQTVEPPARSPIPMASAAEPAPAAPAPSASAPSAPAESAPPLNSPGLADSLHFIVVGDTGKGIPGQALVANDIQDWCRTHPCDLVLYAGDNLYPNGPTSVDDPIFQDRFEKYWAGFKVPFFVALGNHDHRGSVQASIDYTDKSDLWNMPDRHYRLVRGPVEFFVLDSGPSSDGGKLDDEQLAWLKTGLTNSRAPWKMALMHHPIRSSGLHDDGPWMISVLEPMLKAAGVAFTFAGHDHNLEVQDDKAWPVEVVSGGGCEARVLGPIDRTSVYARSAMGYAVVDVVRDEARLQMIEVTAAGRKVGFDQRWSRP